MREQKLEKGKEAEAMVGDLSAQFNEDKENLQDRLAVIDIRDSVPRQRLPLREL